MFIDDEDIAAAVAAERLADPASLNDARSLAGNRGKRLSQTLCDMGLLSPQQLCQVYASIVGLPVWDGEGEVNEDSRFSVDFQSANHMLAIRVGGEPAVLIDDPEDDGLVDLIHRIEPDVRILLATPGQIAQAGAEMLGLRGSDEAGPQEPMAADISHLKDLAQEAPIIRMVNDLLLEAVGQGASDIHLEPFRHGIEMRYRIDGVLVSRQAPRMEDYTAVVSRIKILSGLDIAERRAPQDGRMRIRFAGRSVDIRVSTVPSTHGEDVVMRLLDQALRPETLEAAGLSPALCSGIRHCLSKATGLFIVTGPTGSGKTTTLYAALRSMVDGKRKIITVEDPVEYEMAGVTQTQLNEGAGMTFANALRSMLRHDPDIIFVGEIRDRETAEVAIQASLTGHLVLSTLHTNSAVGAVTRFLDMGVADYLLASCLLGASAQRLVRRLCPQCKKAEPAGDELGARLGIAADAPLYHPTGCQACGRTGYSGRIPIGELALVTPGVRQVMLGHPTEEALRAAVAGDAPGKSLFDDGCRLVREGETSMEEVLRVAH